MPIVYGPYTCQMNLCPSENSSKWTFDSAGESYEVDFDGRPHDRPHISQCKRIIAENPKACAEFLQAYLAAFAKIFLGWPIDMEYQFDPKCLFGRIMAAYYKYESSTRGGLHAHGQLIQSFLQSKFLRDLLADADGNGKFADKLFSFFESVMCAFFPIPDIPISNVERQYLVPRFNGKLFMKVYVFRCNIITFLIFTEDIGEFEPINLSWDPTVAKGFNRKWDELHRVVPLEGMYKLSYDECQVYLRETTDTTHGHGHTHTCKQGDRIGDHYDCRLGMDLPLVECTQCIKEGVFAVRRDVGSGMRPAFIPGLQLACPSNHVMQLTCEVTRWMRNLLLWQDAQNLSDTPVNIFICR